MAFRICTLRVLALVPLFATSACNKTQSGTQSPLVKINEGSFWMGSDAQERATAIETLAAFDPSAWRHVYGWIKNELPRQQRNTSSYEIMRLAVTQYDYYRYIQLTGQPEPFVSEKDWESMGTHIPYPEIRPAMWVQGRPPKDRGRHPVTFVSHDDAQRYCQWWGHELGGKGRLPREDEWERAARGDKGQHYPWGNELRPALLNAYESNIAQTSPVSAFSEGVSPHGAVGMAGNVFEWTDTQAPDLGYIVKGGAYDLSGAMARPAARHSRPAAQKHAAIGFRCVFVRKDSKPSSSESSRASVKKGKAPASTKRSR